jgi:hypothetical protein
MLILEAPSKGRAVLSGCSVHIGGLSQTARRSMGASRRLWTSLKGEARYEGTHSVNATPFKRWLSTNPQRQERMTVKPTGERSKWYRQ